MKRLSCFIIGLLLLVVGCTDTTSHSKAVYMLLDTSGTYTPRAR